MISQQVSSFKLQKVPLSDKCYEAFQIPNSSFAVASEEIALLCPIYLTDV